MLWDVCAEILSVWLWRFDRSGVDVNLSSRDAREQLENCGKLVSICAALRDLFFLAFVFDLLTSVFFRAAKRLNPSVTNSFNGRTVWSWSTASAIARVSRWYSNRSSSSAGPESSRRPPRSSSWVISGTCSIRGPCRVKRVGFSLCPQTAASSRSRLLRPTTASCWSSMKYWTWSRSPEHWREGWPELRALSKVCPRFLERNGSSECGIMMVMLMMIANC